MSESDTLGFSRSLVSDLCFLMLFCLTKDLLTSCTYCLSFIFMFSKFTVHLLQEDRKFSYLNPTEVSLSLIPLKCKQCKAGMVIADFWRPETPQSLCLFLTWLPSCLPRWLPQHQPTCQHVNKKLSFLSRIDFAYMTSSLLSGFLWPECSCKQGWEP